jgi:hypothetical protein
MGQALSKHPGGRPTKYSKAILDTTMDYIANYESYGDTVPQIAGLAQVLETNRETIHRWIKEDDKKEFSNMVSKILSAQERALVNGGLGNKYNSGITKLILSKHGYTDTQDKQGLSVNVTINRGTTEIEVNDNKLTIDNE